ncbi:acetate--CoA ligase [Pseudomonas panipatensis]|uniref:acetate--CoA ligase n=1 Tax=Pseudomonas panipatensis TaxID=428992 RepID=A0A1G8LBF3_9PSED|nr:acetate--CoA ligase [Pseudomonas panipatensis]SDI53022.1 acetyl-CoA synthetase [Pseudomonas panipatensis]SMP75269.1 acetyl-CoA synthetase [Pseudomonas panipatensis]
MRPPIIEKTASDLRLPPNWPASEQPGPFFWTTEAAALAGLPGGGLNLAYEAVDRHARGDRAEHIALRLLDGEGGSRDISYAQLSALSNRFANVLRGLGVAPGARLFILCERGLELFLGVLGGLKNGCVVSPLFSAFGPEPIATRLRLGEGSILLTSETLYRRKVAGIRAELPALRHVLVHGQRADERVAHGCLDLQSLMAQADETFSIARTRADSPSLLHFTSGTTGMPKGALHVHGAALTHYVTGKYALDLHPEDIYWCSADPGWVTGTSYGILAPLLLGVTSIVDSAEFDAERWYSILEQQRVSVWYTAPTAIRLLMKAGVALAQRHRFPDLRFIASVGEPLNAEAVWWGKEVLGLPIHDNWWQTETGGIMIANLLAWPIKPGSMGKPLPGVEAAIIEHREDGTLRFLAAGKVGELALKQPWPAMFRAYLGQEERYRRCFAGNWYLSGDLARRDADGYYWFVGRGDDVIKSAGHLIGPFEVESVLMEHPAVAEAAVVGKPEPLLGELVKAFVALKDGYQPSAALHDELLGHARKRLGAAVAPKELEFQAQLPHTRSGKLMRRLLKARELGLPEGDTSTLENPR